MSGYEKSGVSSLGGGKPGQFTSGFGSTLVGGEVAMNRRKLRKAFKSNNVAAAGVKASCGPFRNAYNLGDPLSRKNMSCGGPNQVNDTNSRILNHKMADSVSNSDCGKVVHGVTPSEVSLDSSFSTEILCKSFQPVFQKIVPFGFNPCLERGVNGLIEEPCIDCSSPKCPKHFLASNITDGIYSVVF